MTVLAIVASVILGVAFLVAGGSKIAAGSAWSSQARELGAPPLVIPVLPWIEITIGAVLIVQVARRPAALFALAVLAGFTALIVVRLAQGRHPPCACFGAWSAKPLGWGHVARNAGLMLLAVLAAAA